MSYSDILSKDVIQRIDKAVKDLSSNEMRNIFSEGGSFNERTTMASYALQSFIENHFSIDDQTLSLFGMMLANPEIPMEHLQQQERPQLNTSVITLEHNTFLEFLLENGANLLEHYELYPNNITLIRMYAEDYGALNRVEEGSLFFTMLNSIVENNQVTQLIETLNSNVYSAPRLILFRELLEITNLRVLQDQDISSDHREILLNALRQMNGQDLPAIETQSYTAVQALVEEESAYTADGQLVVEETHSNQVQGIPLGVGVIEVDENNVPWAVPNRIEHIIHVVQQPVFNEQQLLSSALNDLNTGATSSGLDAFNNNCG